METWLVIADASVAKIFAVNKIKFWIEKETPRLIKELTHPQSRLRDSDLATDRQGRFHGRSGGGCGSFIEATAPKKHEAEHFSQQLVSELEAKRLDNSFQDIILVAPPSFLGMLNKWLKKIPSLKNKVIQVIEKDYTRLSTKELEKYLKEEMD